MAQFELGRLEDALASFRRAEKESRASLAAASTYTTADSTSTGVHAAESPSVNETPHQGRGLNQWPSGSRSYQEGGNRGLDMSSTTETSTSPPSVPEAENIEVHHAPSLPPEGVGVGEAGTKEAREAIVQALLLQVRVR